MLKRNSIMISNLLLVFVLVSVFAFVGGYYKVKASQENFNLVYSSISPPNSIANQSVRVFKEEIEKLTDGQITIELFFSGQLYNQKGSYTAIRRGDLDLTWAGFTFYNDQLPYLAMFNSAYFFKDEDHFEKVWNSSVGEQIFNDMEEKVGVRPLYVGIIGPRNVTLRDIGKEVRTPSDMKGVKLRVPDSQSWMLMGKALGANPTPFDYNEVYMALKTGSIDGQENPISHIMDKKFYEVSKYLILTGHMQTIGGLTMNADKWNQFGPELQKKIRIASKTAAKRCKQLSMEYKRESIDKMEEEGIIVIKPDIEAFKSYAEEFYKSKEEYTKEWDWDLYNKIQALVD